MQTQQEPLNPEVMSKENSPIDPANAALIKSVSKPFEDSLADLDKARGWNLSQVWKDCLRIHDDNQMLRMNMKQMQVILQAESVQWAKTNERIEEYMAGLEQSDPDYIDKLNKALASKMKINEINSKLNLTLRDLKKEVRMTEFQSRFFFHVNMVQQFMAGMTAILFKHLQSTDKLNAILDDMRNLSKVFAFSQSNERKEDDA